MVEAENFSRQTSAASTWQPTSTPPGFSGGQALYVGPDGLAQEPPCAGAMLEFDVNFATAGTHYVWARGYQTSSTDDSVYLEINDTCNGNILQTAQYNSWQWMNQDFDDVVTIDVPSAGAHRLRIYSREDGFTLDKLLLTTDATYRPEGVGPAESDAAPCAASCGNDSCDTEETCGDCPSDCGVCANPCGDALCANSENCSTCPVDCGACPDPCGDGMCAATESCGSCPADCGACTDPCGDGTCSATESCNSCTADCGACPNPCGDETCSATESCGSCPADCGACTGGHNYGLAFSTIMDGTDGLGAMVRDVAVDAQGNVYVTGGADAADFPTTPGAYDRTLNDGLSADLGGSFPIMDAFAMKFAPDGTLLWSTFVGGRNYDRAYAIDVDPAGNVYIAGRAGSGFPTTAGSVQPGFAGDGHINGAYGPQDGFVTKLSADGSRVIWSTYVGGNGRGFLRDMAVDSSGVVYLGGSEFASFAHISAGAYQTSTQGGADAMYGKLSADGSTILWASFIGGRSGVTRDGSNPSVQADSATGELFAVHSTVDDDLCANFGGSSYQRQLGGGRDLLITRWSAAGTLLACSYFGGAADEHNETHNLALDGNANFVVGALTDTQVPTTAGVVSPLSQGGQDAFVANISKDGTTLIASTHVGGSDGEGVEGIAFHAGAVYLSGTTKSPNYPLTPNAYQSNRRGNRDAVITVLSGDLTQILYSTLFGGGDREEGRTIAVGPSGAIASGGQTISTDFPLLNSVETQRDGGNFSATATVYSFAPM